MAACTKPQDQRLAESLKAEMLAQVMSDSLGVGPWAQFRRRAYSVTGPPGGISVAMA